MTKKKAQHGRAEPRKAGRQGASKSFWLPSDLVGALDLYVQNTRPKTTLTAVVQIALEEYLTRVGFWPPGESGS